VPAHIYLYRHAAVDFDNTKRVAFRDFRATVDAYNAAPLVAFLPAQPVPRCDFIMTSTLRRSPDSAMELFGYLDVNDTVFREAELPDLPALPFRAKPKTLFAIARILWFFGRRKNCESRDRFYARVDRAAQLIVRVTGEHPCVVVVGHGVLNHFLSRALHKHQFKSQKPRARGYGMYTLFVGP
jgi:broad specificity phosphatase PhoE